jgi:hypothetical protein
MAQWYPWPEASDDHHPAYGHSRFLLGIFPENQWRPRELRLALNPFMGSMKPSTASYWRPIEIAFMFAPAVGAGISGGGQEVLPYTCISIGYIIAAAYLGIAVALSFSRPYRMPLDTVLCPMLYAMLGISLLVKMTSSALAQRVTGNEALEVGLGLAAAILQVLQVSLQLFRTLAALYISWLEGRAPQVTPDVHMLTELDQIGESIEMQKESSLHLDGNEHDSSDVILNADNHAAVDDDDVLALDMLETLLETLGATEADANDALPDATRVDEFLSCPLPTAKVEADRDDSDGSFFGIVGYFSSVAKKVVDQVQRKVQRSS